MNNTGGIDASGWGYGPNQGPGQGANFSGAGYGGNGGATSHGDGPGGSANGNTNKPSGPGSGSYFASGIGEEGGGFIRIEASQNVMLNGSLLANYPNGIGVPGSGYNDGGGSGGGIFVQCRTFTGSTSGVVKALGGPGLAALGGGGGGGRIAIWYGQPVPTNLWSKILAGQPKSSLTYTNFSALSSYLGTNSAAGGAGYGTSASGSNGTAVVIYYYQPAGTVFLLQ